MLLRGLAAFVPLHGVQSTQTNQMNLGGRPPQSSDQGWRFLRPESMKSGRMAIQGSSKGAVWCRWVPCGPACGRWEALQGWGEGGVLDLMVDAASGDFATKGRFQASRRGWAPQSKEKSKPCPIRIHKQAPHA